jgi:putative FmdB family regulatory protein
MPTYEYACKACGHEWEQTQRITEEPIQVCPVCVQPAAHRLISAGTNFILKGSGWYSDLYASPKPSAAKPSDDKADKTEKKGEKPEANTATSHDKADKPADKPAAKATTDSPKPSSTSSPPST